MIDSILKIIITPWVSMDNEEKKADEEKFSEITKILEPEEVNLWCDDLWNGCYRKEKNALMDNYFRFIYKPNSYFFRKSLTKNYERFNKSFFKLRGFLLGNFFTNQHNIDFVELHYEEKNPDLYAEKLENLRVLVAEFEESYKKLIISGREKYIGKFPKIICLLLLVSMVVLCFIRIY
jgi:hypothetical protein